MVAVRDRVAWTDSTGLVDAMRSRLRVRTNLVILKALPAA